MRLNWNCFYDVLRKAATSESVNMRQMSEHLPQYEKLDVFYAMLKLSETNFVVSEVMENSNGIYDICIKKLTNEGYKELTKFNHFGR